MKTLLNIILVTFLLMIVSSCKKEESLTGSFTDSRDGTVYKTIKIGNQTWMAENLAYLPAVHRSTEGSETEPRYYVYGYSGNDVNEAIASANYPKYGVLYNFEAAESACPTGWHLPSDADWFEMEVLLGMSVDEQEDTGPRGLDEAVGDKLKSKSGWGWDDFNDEDGNGTNESGFTALPGGIRMHGGGYDEEGTWGYFWGSTQDNSTHYFARYLASDIEAIMRFNYYIGYGLSVRCVKD